MTQPTFEGMDEVEHVGAQREQGRLGRKDYVNAEAIYAAAWRKEQGRHNLLAIILAAPGEHAARVTQRDAKVAATVITWLGSGVGMSFVHECERKIEAAHEARHPASRADARYERANKNFPKQTPLDRAKAQLQKVRQRLEAAI